MLIALVQLSPVNTGMAHLLNIFHKENLYSDINPILLQS